MTTFNKSYDGGTFEEMTAIQRYEHLVELRQQCMFQLDVALANKFKDMFIRYHVLMVYIENKMHNFNA